jgi:general secretion pathway protein A
MYTDYWGLKKHPFDNVPDPAMYFDMHQSVDDAVSEVLFAIEEGDECLAVVVGPVGSGKTMCLRIVLDSLDHSKYRIAFVTNPDMTFTQMLREIVGQLEGKQCEENRKDRLFEIFNKLLFETNDKGQRVVIFIDEGNVIKPQNLDSLRLLTNMQDDKQNLFTIILAGQPELGRRLEDPRRANLFQRIGVYCKIHGLDSLEMMRDYVEHRLERAGLSGRKIFSAGAYKAIWENSENGTPRIVNKICKLCLKAAETNTMNEITDDVVNGIADRFMRTYRSQRGKPQTRVPVEHEEPDEQAEQAKPPKAAVPVKPVEPAKPVKETVKLEEPVKQIEPAKSPRAAEQAKPIEPAKAEEEKAAFLPPVQNLRIEQEDKTKTPAVLPKPQAKEVTRAEKTVSKAPADEIKPAKQAQAVSGNPFEEWEKMRNEILGMLSENADK